MKPPIPAPRALLELGLAILACTALPPAAEARSQLHAFNLVDFFRGKTHGEGTLKIIFQSPQKISVDSEGSQLRDGSLLLKQTIHQAGDAPRIRYWRMRQSAPNRFEGTLTDAAGPVRVEQTGDGIRITYEAQNHLYFDQILTPISDKEVRNSMKVKRFGIIVAHYSEEIRKPN